MWGCRESSTNTHTQKERGTNDKTVLTGLNLKTGWYNRTGAPIYIHYNRHEPHLADYNLLSCVFVPEPGYPARGYPQIQTEEIFITYRNCEKTWSSYIARQNSYIDMAIKDNKTEEKLIKWGKNNKQND